MSLGKMTTCDVC